jgi:hypothetical protein
MLTLTYDSNHPRAGHVALRLPSARRVLRVTLDGKAVTFRSTAVGDDRFVTVDTIWGPHRIEVALGAVPRRGSSHGPGA